MVYFSKETGGFYPDSIFDTFPPDVVEITDDLYRSLKDGQSEGKKVSWDEDTCLPTLVEEVIELTQYQVIKRQIVALEMQQTPRRIRESILGTDDGWLADIDAQIAALRAQL